MKSRSQNYLSRIVHHPLAWLLLGALCIFSVYLPRFYVGFFNDDAIFIIGARSLWQGKFVNLSHPMLPLINRLGIGFSLLLAPWVKIAAPHYDVLKGVSLTLSLGSIVLFFILARHFLPFVGTIIVVSLLALNPAFAMHSSILMADPCFVAAVLAGFVVLHDHLTRVNDRGILLGLLLGWAWLIRPAGGLAVIAATATLLLAGRWRSLRIIAPLAFFPWIFQSIRNAAQTGTTNQYLSQWGSALPYLADPTKFFEHTLRVSHTFFVYSLLGLQLPFVTWAKAVSLTLSIGILFLCCRGIAWGLKSRTPQAYLIFGMALFSALYFLMHLLWPAITQRYALPLLPFLLLFCGMAVFPSVDTRPRFSSWTVAVLMIMLGLYGYRHWSEIRKMSNGEISPMERPFPGTLDWIRENTPSSSVFLGRAPLIYLATGRQGYMQILSPNASEFYDGLNYFGITHILSQPTQILSVYHDPRFNDNEANARNRAWITSNPRVFKPVYVNAHEQTEVYEVIQDHAGRKVPGRLSPPLSVNRKR